MKIGSLVLQLLVPILISCLLDSSQLKVTNHLGKALHGHALYILTRIGSQYPQVGFYKLSVEYKELLLYSNVYNFSIATFQEFKSLLSQLPDLRTKLESAARANQTTATSKMGALSVGGVVDSKSAPTIKLKTDFSNFSLN